ncbi:MAG: hypothetical protein ACJA0S_000828 [Rickettsiales bacterium]|jgi:uncharacterized protein
MDITPQIPKNCNLINGYGSEGFKINEILHQNSIIMTSSQIIEVKINSVEEFFNADLKNILDSNPEILLIGTGKNHQIISADLKNKIKSQYPEISIDEMTTGSACRTYNILMMEDRNVVAFLMPIL